MSNSNNESINDYAEMNNQTETHQSNQNENSTMNNNSFALGHSVQYSTTSIGGVQRIRPKFFKLFNVILSSHFDPIMDYLDLLELCSVRAVSHCFLSLVHEYYQRRLKFEIGLMTN